MSLTKEVDSEGRVCIVIPPSPFLADERVFISLGALKVAASLRGAGRPVDVLDLSGVHNFKDAAFEYLRTPERAKVIGLSSTTPQFPSSVQILQKGTLGRFPFPDRELVDFHSYHYSISDESNGKKVDLEATSMIAQLGCPFECTFCGGRDSYSYRVARPRSSESIVEEVALLAEKYGMRGIMFYDDEINISNDTLLAMCEALTQYQEKSGLDLRFRAFAKAQLLVKHPEQAKALFDAGFREILTGVESGDDEMLKTMRKLTTRDINSEFVRICHAAGLRVKALMSIGHPGESEESIKNSIEWVQANKPDEVDFALIEEYPGAPIFDHSVTHPTMPDVWVYTEKRTQNVLFSRAINYAKEAAYYKGVPGDYTSHVWTETLSSEQLVWWRDHAERVSRTNLGLKPIQHIDMSKYTYQVGAPLPHWILKGSGR